MYGHSIQDNAGLETWPGLRRASIVVVGLPRTLRGTYAKTYPGSYQHPLLNTTYTYELARGWSMLSSAGSFNVNASPRH